MAEIRASGPLAFVGSLMIACVSPADVKVPEFVADSSPEVAKVPAADADSSPAPASLMLFCFSESSSYRPAKKKEKKKIRDDT